MTTIPPPLSIVKMEANEYDVASAAAINDNVPPSVATNPLPLSIVKMEVSDDAAVAVFNDSVSSIVKMEVTDDDAAILAAAINDNIPLPIANPLPLFIVKMEVTDDAAVAAINNHVPPTANMPGAEPAISDATNAAATASHVSSVAEKRSVQDSISNTESKRPRLETNPNKVATNGCEQDEDRKAIVDAYFTALEKEDSDETKKLLEQMDTGYTEILDEMIAQLGDDMEQTIIAEEERKVIFENLNQCDDDDFKKKCTLYEALLSNLKSTLVKTKRCKLIELQMKIAREAYYQLSEGDED
jgi:hypothetical protein